MHATRSSYGMRDRSLTPSNLLGVIDGKETIFSQCFAAKRKFLVFCCDFSLFTVYMLVQIMFSVVDYGQELAIKLQDWNLKLKSQ